MEFIDGFNLSTRVKQHGPLPIEDAVEYVRQTALGLQHAYEKGIVHRDIKPGNILVTSAKAHGEHKSLVKILDFGLARFASEGAERERLTEVGKLLGTIDYMAPEQAHAARDADIRADIYSLGCTLYYLLTGRPPFGGETVLEKLTPRMTGEAPWIRAVRPEIAPALEDVIRTMMARRPEDRPLTPLDAANALAPFAQSEPRAPGTAAAPLFGSPLGVAMALPVAPDAVRGEVMMAQPIMASASPEDPSFLGMTATGRDMSDASAAATPRAPTTKRPLPAKLLLLLGGGAALVSLVSCACILGMLYFRDATPRKSGTVRITQVKWSTEDQKLIPGRHHHALVWIERVDFQGPVKIWFKELPPGVVSDELTLAPQIDRGQVKVTVSFGTEPVKKTVKIVAECEEAGARVEMPIALEVKADPAGLKKQAK
jgi:hypothetical protein